MRSQRARWWHNRRPRQTLRHSGRRSSLHATRRCHHRQPAARPAGAGHHTLRNWRSRLGPSRPRRRQTPNCNQVTPPGSTSLAWRLQRTLHARLAESVQQRRARAVSNLQVEQPSPSESTQLGSSRQVPAGGAGLLPGGAGLLPGGAGLFAEALGAGKAAAGASGTTSAPSSSSPPASSTTSSTASTTAARLSANTRRSTRRPHSRMGAPIELGAPYTVPSAAPVPPVEAWYRVEPSSDAAPASGALRLPRKFCRMATAQAIAGQDAAARTGCTLRGGRAYSGSRPRPQAERPVVCSVPWTACESRLSWLPALSGRQPQHELVLAGGGGGGAAGPDSSATLLGPPCSRAGRAFNRVSKQRK